MKNKKPKKLVNTATLSREEWLRWRRAGIGGSDAAAVAGLNPWRSPVAVFLEKSDTEAALDAPTGFRLKIGHDLEAYVARLFEEETGKKVRRNNHLLAHGEHRFIIANIDREVVGESAILECKTTNSYAAKDWAGGQIPIHYEIQCLHYLLVTGAERCYIAVLIGNEDFQWRTIERDEEALANLEKIEVDFWREHVEKDEPPAPDGSANFDEYLQRKYRNATADAIDLPGSFSQTFERIAELKALKKQMDEELKTLEQEIKAGLGEHERGSAGDFVATWKAETRTRIDSKAIAKDHPDLYEKYSTKTTTRVLRIRPAKKESDEK